MTLEPQALENVKNELLAVGSIHLAKFLEDFKEYPEIAKLLLKCIEAKNNAAI